MKKIFTIALFVIALFPACNSDIKSDIDDLEDRVGVLEKSVTVAGVKFVDTNMVITFSDNKTETLPMPEGLNGINGTNGTGITKITFDQTTNLLTIVLSNGNESVFKIINDGYANMVATLVSDSNGKMLVSEITMGALPVATLTYDDNYNLTNILSKTFYDGMMVNNFEAKKVYTDGVLTSLNYTAFAQKKQVAYNSTYVGSTYEYDNAHTNFYYTSNANDTTYTLHLPSGSSYFYVYPLVVKHTVSELPSDLSGYYAAYNSDTAYHFNYLTWSSQTTAGVTTYSIWYNIDYKYFKTGEYNIGDVKFSESVNTECNADGNPVKVSYGSDTYAQLTYDGTFIAKGELYNKDDAGEWQKLSKYLTFEYNSSKLLKSVWLNETGKDPLEIGRTEYDEKGNPVKIYAIGDEVSTSYFDPFSHPENPWQDVIVYENNTLQLVAEIEYNYDYKNFFGNSIDALFPFLKNYNVMNAPVKVSDATSLSYMWLDYSTFNDSGYPEMLTCNVYSKDSYTKKSSATAKKDYMPSNINLELSISYITKK
ncbi:MAG TPA: hypothetical protein PLR88_06360 [Bacteroidales bacterium]|nr:hypothetical protein [Bacteroidales bacterium]